MTIEGQAPDIAIYSRSHGEPTHNEPMLGEVAWEPLFDPSNFEAGNRKEKLELQKKFLYDAWRYLTADDPDDIIIIEDQLLSGDSRHRALAQECKSARKIRSRNAQYRRRKRDERGLPAKSIEVDSDSESGYESDEMPPPPRPGSNRPSGGYERTPSEPLMSGGRGNSVNAQRDGSRSARSNEEILHSTSSAGSKRKRTLDSASQRDVRSRADGPRSGLFCTRSNSLRASGRHHSEGSGTASGATGGLDANNGLDEQDALDEAIRRSQALGEDERIWDENGGLHPDDAMSVATRESMAPEGGSDM